MRLCVHPVKDEHHVTSWVPHHRLTHGTQLFECLRFLDPMRHPAVSYWRQLARHHSSPRVRWTVLLDLYRFLIHRSCASMRFNLFASLVAFARPSRLFHTTTSLPPMYCP